MKDLPSSVGAGLVGSSAAFALQCGGLSAEIALLDLNLDLAGGHAWTCSTARRAWPTGHRRWRVRACAVVGHHLHHGRPSAASRISRLDLINRNTDLFLGILADVAKAGMKKDAIVFVVSNPVDILKPMSLPTGSTLPGRRSLAWDAARYHPLPQPHCPAAQGRRRHRSTP